MALAAGTPARSIHKQFEALLASYRLESQRGIPMSVHQRYEDRLAHLREELRNRKAACPIGEVLKRMGAVDEEGLASALRTQEANGKRRLLGEILVDLGWVDRSAVKAAVSVQTTSLRSEREDRECV